MVLTRLFQSFSQIFCKEIFFSIKFFAFKFLYLFFTFLRCSTVYFERFHWNSRQFSTRKFANSVRLRFGFELCCFQVIPIFSIENSQSPLYFAFRIVFIVVLELKFGFSSTFSPIFIVIIQKRDFLLILIL